jgi:hypothetical protein
MELHRNQTQVHFLASVIRLLRIKVHAQQVHVAAVTVEHCSATAVMDSTAAMAVMQEKSATAVTAALVL